MSTNAGFRPEELNRRQFQRAAAMTLDAQAGALQQSREFAADLSSRMDRLDLALSNLEQRQRSFEQMPVLARLWWLVRGAPGATRGRDLGYGWRCPYCHVAQDEGEQSGVYWHKEPVCAGCAPKVHALRGR